jgi:hypothetical protein
MTSALYLTITAWKAIAAYKRQQSGTAGGAAG